jgi:hypothetical protein
MAQLWGINITGNWRGQYWHHYKGPSELPPVGFTLSLKKGWLGRFAGGVQDDPESGMPEPGLVRGNFRYPRIAFTKFMPVFYITDGDGKVVKFRDWLNSGGEYWEFDRPHPPISYEGEFIDADHAKGIWTIKGAWVWIEDRQAIETPLATGGWSLERCVS